MAVYNKTEEIKKLKEQITQDFFIEGENGVIIVKLYKNSETRENKTEDHDILKWLKENPEDISRKIKDDKNVRAEKYPTYRSYRNPCLFSLMHWRGIDQVHTEKIS